MSYIEAEITKIDIFKFVLGVNLKKKVIPTCIGIAQVNSRKIWALVYFEYGG